MPIDSLTSSKKDYANRAKLADVVGRVARGTPLRAKPKVFYSESGRVVGVRPLDGPKGREGKIGGGRGAEGGGRGGGRGAGGRGTGGVDHKPPASGQRERGSGWAASAFASTSRSTLSQFPVRKGASASSAARGSPSASSTASSSASSSSSFRVSTNAERRRVDKVDRVDRGMKYGPPGERAAGARGEGGGGARGGARGGR